MEQHKAAKRLAVLREELELATEDHDWSDLTEIDQDIVAIARQFPPEVRGSVLARELAQMRQVYGQVLGLCEQHRHQLRNNMQQLRQRRGGIQGYLNSLAAGNQELRGRHDPR